ncbi:hypothetical protein ACFSQ7_19995 [Paenibacillus rhizoplanae]
MALIITLLLVFPRMVRLQEDGGGTPEIGGGHPFPYLVLVEPAGACA